MEINNCNWAFRCSQKWESLENTASTKVKYCRDCQKNVFLCQTEEEIEYHSKRLNCIALEEKTNNAEEIKWMTLGKFLPPKYVGATMRVILEPTYSLDKDQIKFLVRSFDLGKMELNWKEILCDGQCHTLKTELPPNVAEDLSKRMFDRNISHTIEIEPD